MIRVAPAQEPGSFDARVRQPGREVLGRLPAEDIRPSDLRPFWRNAIPDLMERYNQICAYSCLRIHPVTGGGTVDHFVPVSAALRLAYEWSNFRLACARMNSRKGKAVDILDPFHVEDGWFALELVAFQVVPGSDLSDTTTGRVVHTIERLGLNVQSLCDARAEYASEYWRARIDWDHLLRSAPFVARELERQGRLARSSQRPVGIDLGVVVPTRFFDPLPDKLLDEFEGFGPEDIP